MKNAKNGFTIVELVIVIAVIAILAAVLIPTFSSLIKNANDAAALSELRQIQTLVEIELADDSVWEFYDGEGNKIRIIGSEEGRMWASTAELADALNACPALDGYGSFEKEEFDLIYTAKSGKGTAVWSKVVAYGSYGLEYELNEDGQTYRVVGRGACTDTDIVIPPTYNGKPVTKIGDVAFYLCLNLESITIPYGVTTVGNSAFAKCENLESVTIPESVTSIGDDAFGYCLSLTGITIPDSVTSIEQYAFARTGLESVTIPGSVKSIGAGAFHTCMSLTNVTISNGVEEIGYEAFYDCRNLSDVDIPSSVTLIKKDSFVCNSDHLIISIVVEGDSLSKLMCDENWRSDNCEIIYIYPIYPEE